MEFYMDDVCDDDGDLIGDPPDVHGVHYLDDDDAQDK